MPRCYIHIRSRNGLNEDFTGKDLSDIDAAYGEVLGMIRELQELKKLWEFLGFLLPDVRDDIAFEIAEESGQTLLTVRFSERKDRIQ
jgi:hypothetical protein